MYERHATYASHLAPKPMPSPHYLAFTNLLKCLGKPIYWPWETLLEFFLLKYPYESGQDTQTTKGEDSCPGEYPLSEGYSV